MAKCPAADERSSSRRQHLSGNAVWEEVAESAGADGPHGMWQKEQSWASKVLSLSKWQKTAVIHGDRISAQFQTCKASGAYV
jgi:hypothetical protein